MIGRLPDYPEPPPKTKRQTLLDIKADLEDELAAAMADDDAADDEIGNINHQLEAVYEQLDMVYIWSEKGEDRFETFEKWHAELVRLAKEKRCEPLILPINEHPRDGFDDGYTPTEELAMLAQAEV